MVFSCGLWGIVWAILILSDNPQFHCAQCGYSDEVKYLANPYLRSEEAQRNSEQGWQGRSVTQEVSLLLGLGIFVMPYVFAWFTLREGYSSWAKKVSFGWLTVFVIYMIFLFGYILPNQSVRQTSVEPPRQSPTSSATPLPTPLSPSQARRETFNENPTVWVAGCKDGFKTGKSATIDAEGNEWEVATLGSTLVERTYKGANKDVWTAGWIHGWATAYNIHSPYSRYRPDTAEKKKERIAKACSGP